MKQIECTILVEPTAKARARVAVVNGHAHGYTPAKTRTAEADIKASIRQQLGIDGVVFDDKVPLSLSATFYRSRPQHLPKRVTQPVTKPDCDNYGKLLLDALNGYVFKDDSQVVTLTLRKRYCTEGQAPRIELKICEVCE